VFEDALSTLRRLAEQRIATKNREYNSHASINRLPNEIIGYILELVVAGTRQKSMDKTISRDSSRCLKVINEVSSHFRDVALATPRLWGYVETTDTNPINPTFLARSKGAPLHVTIGCESYQDITAEAQVLFKQLSPLVDRIKSFHCGAFLGDAIGMWEYLTNPAPTLEALVLAPEGNTSYLSRESSSGYSKIMRSLFAGTAPRLKTLHLKLVRIPWDSPIYGPTVTSMHLASLHYSDRPSSEELSKLLSRCPNLEDLRLKGAGPLAPLTPPSTQVVQMLHLSNIEISDVDSTAAGFVLGVIEVEDTSTVYISIDIRLGHTQSLRTVLPKASDRSLSHSLLTNINTFEIHPAVRKFSLFTIGNRQSLCITRFRTRTNTLVLEPDDIVFPSLTTVHIHKLEEERHALIARGLLQRLSSHIQRVKIIDSQFLDAVLEFLLHPISGQSSKQWNVPLLEEIVLSNCQVDTERLVTSIAARSSYQQEGGERLKTDAFSLKLENCSMSQDEITAMSECMVGDLLWDGN